MKFAGTALIIICWAVYLLGHDRKPTPQWVHSATNLLFLSLTMTVWVAL